MTLPTPDHLTTASHWGVFRAAVDDGRITLTPAAGDYFPSPNVHAIEAQPYMKSRVLHPMVRKSFLEKKPRTHKPRPGMSRAGDWDTALDLGGLDQPRLRHLWTVRGFRAVLRLEVLGRDSVRGDTRPPAARVPRRLREGREQLLERRDAENSALRDWKRVSETAEF